MWETRSAAKANQMWYAKAALEDEKNLFKEIFVAFNEEGVVQGPSEDGDPSYLNVLFSGIKGGPQI